ncbi:MAG: hypothetical protein KC636_14695 [Myxococcales bacterium]|nr:hypothetical protein [Myxococcales bacterium]
MEPLAPTLLDYLAMGGPLMLPIIALGALGLGTAIAGLVSGARRLALAGAVMGVTAVVLGVAGYFLGLAELERALSTIEVEYRERAQARGQELALVPLWFSALAAAPALVLGAIGLARRS